MNIDDPEMFKKLIRALEVSGNLYTLSDIEEGLNSGSLQSHVEGDTWAITQVHDWPQRRAVNILFVIGSIEDTAELEAKIEKWAKDINANLLTATGREGWWKVRTPGWKTTGTLYSKDI